MRIPRYYWDTSVWIAYLLNEATREPGELDRATDVVRAADAGKALIVTAEMTIGEILDPFGLKIDQRFLEIFDRPNYQLLQSSVAVQLEVARLRTHTRLKVPDATHLATALLANVDEMHSFDEDHLLPLDGKEIVRGLRIRKPSVPEPTLGI